MRWIAILYGRVHADLAATGGIHTGQDAAKMLLAGATVTMMASALLRNGSSYLSTVERELREWMEQYEYESVAQMRGALSQMHCEDPTAYERAQYMKALTYYKPAQP
jgi:dihydroorotate dehydrogenase (fumarate)